jgi:predicted MFS family arabinose efflux permease
LTGTPITGALLDRYGFYAPIVWSGVTILAGSLFFVTSAVFQKKAKGTWKV